jgi:hypothetical protein
MIVPLLQSIARQAHVARACHSVSLCNSGAGNPAIDPKFAKNRLQPKFTLRERDYADPVPGAPSAARRIGAIFAHAFQEGTG